MQILALFGLLFSFFSPYAAIAAESKPVLSATPSLLQIDLRTESPDSDLYYKNLSTVPLDITLTAKDFSAFNDEGKVNFLPETDAKNYHYSLSSWIQFSTQTISLDPGESKTVRIHIQKEKLPLGGHYAAVLATFSERETPAARTISLQGVLSTLVFVRAGKGFEREEASIPAFTITDPFPTFPKQFSFRFQNTGNVDLTPYGTVDITDMFGRFVARGIVNEGSLMTLPESIRRYTLSVERKVPFLIPGLYTASLRIRYGEQKKTVSHTMTFFSEGSIPGMWIGMGLIGIIGGILVVRKLRS